MKNKTSKRGATKLQPSPKTRRSNSVKTNRRFLGADDMSTIKHDADIYNSQEKRGELKRPNTRRIIVCGCGATGCAIHD